MSHLRQSIFAIYFPISLARVLLGRGMREMKRPKKKMEGGLFCFTGWRIPLKRSERTIRFCGALRIYRAVVNRPFNIVLWPSCMKSHTRQDQTGYLHNVL